MHVLAIHLAKRSFQVCGPDQGGAVLFNLKVSRKDRPISSSGAAGGRDNRDPGHRQGMVQLYLDQIALLAAKIDGLMWRNPSSTV